MHEDSRRSAASVLFRYRMALGIFVFCLVVSGISALPLQRELILASKLISLPDAANYHALQGLRRWIAFVDFGLRDTYTKFPFFGYATDWLGFGHFVIAAFFVLPFANPKRYRGILHIGLFACAGVVAIALICGPIRGIPFSWRLIDCSFGIVGAIPLLYCLRITRNCRQ